MELETGSIEIPVGAQTMGAYLARPQNEAPRGSVIVWMEIFGVNEHIRAVTRRVAEEGYIALAPDFFHRSMPGAQLGYDEAGFAEGMKGLNQLQAEEMSADAQAACAAARAQAGANGKLGVMGFCIGGHMAYLTACTCAVDATASFYGGGVAAPQGPGGGASTLSRTPKVSGRMLCLFGGKDSMIPPPQVAAVREALAAAGPQHEVVVYEDADHGFHCDQRESYNQAASADAWRRVTELFAQTLR